MAKYVNNIKDITGTNTIYIEEYNKLVRGKTIVMIGDSSVNQMGQTELDLMKKAMPDCTIVNTGLSARWSNVYDTVRSYSGTPDIICLLAGSNDLVSNETVAETCGAPDIALKEGTAGDTTAFNCMRLTLSYIRSTWPRAKVYCLQRANHPTKRRSAWYYFKYFEAAIMKEWGVPVIDTNDIINLTYWIETQKAIYVKTDGLHYTSVMYQRYLETLGYMLESNVTPSDMELPGCYYVPASVLVDNTDMFAPANMAACVKWVFQHCYTRAGGNQGQFIAGGAIVPFSSATVFFEFEGNGYYSTDMLSFSHCRATVKRPDHLYWVEATDTTTNINTVLMTESFFDESNPVDIRALPEGDYVFRAQVATASTGFPAGNTAGGHLIVRRNKTFVGEEGMNGLFIFHAYQGNKLYIGTNVRVGDILWAEMQKV